MYDVMIYTNEDARQANSFKMLVVMYLRRELGWGLREALDFCHGGTIRQVDKEQLDKLGLIFGAHLQHKTHGWTSYTSEN